MILFLAACGGDLVNVNDLRTPKDSGSLDSDTDAGSGGGGDTDEVGSAAGYCGLRAYSVDDLLADLRSDRDGTLLACSRDGGWPVDTDEGLLFVVADSGAWSLAGDFDAWAGEAMTADTGFSWLVRDVTGAYKFTDGSAWNADPWARRYTYDEFGEMSLATADGAHLERQFEVGDDVMQARTLRIWVPDGEVTHLLYMHDGQNLFDPSAFYGGWRAQDTAPAGMMLVGIDNTDARMDEYTHDQDYIDGAWYGGAGADYAAYVMDTVRPLIAGIYGEPATVGTLGSSLGGLISFYIADQYPDDWQFAGSMSGTMGWGSIGTSNETIIERYAAAGHRGVPLYLDSGGYGTTCADSDGDGTDDDDLDSADNYCENVQLRDVLAGEGYTFDVDLWHWWEPDATHDEASWAARVDIPFGVFDGL